jgi:hypothetical protein
MSPTSDGSNITEHCVRIPSDERSKRLAIFVLVASHVAELPVWDSKMCLALPLLAGIAILLCFFSRLARPNMWSASLAVHASRRVASRRPLPGEPHLARAMAMAVRGQGQPLVAAPSEATRVTTLSSSRPLVVNGGDKASEILHAAVNWRSAATLLSTLASTTIASTVSSDSAAHTKAKLMTPAVRKRARDAIRLLLLADKGLRSAAAVRPGGDRLSFGVGHRCTSAFDGARCRDRPHRAHCPAGSAG